MVDVSATVSIEIPAFKGQWLIDAVESVFGQTSTDWELSILWDGGDEFARRVVEELGSLRDPRIQTYLGDRRGIASARRFLTERSRSPWILTLDDDDVLAPDAVECFVAAARATPWAGIVRARRSFIDADGRDVREADWFPFAERAFQHGMIRDVFNHSQPALIRRTAYQRTAGWTGFPEYRNAGEDCDIFVRIEEVAPIELLDRVLYAYRLNSRRTSHELGPEGARDMWRRIADGAIARLGLPLRREGEDPPFSYARLPPAPATRDSLEFVIAGDDGAQATRRSILREGLCDYAIRIVPGAAAAARNAGFGRCERRIVAFIDAGVELAPGAIDAVLRRFNDGRADCVAQTDGARRPDSLVVARSEVVRAVGGFDHAFASASIATRDFFMAASRRDFSCALTADAIAAAPPPLDPPPDDVTRFLAKWRVPVAA